MIKAKEEKKIEAKLLANVFVHEVCHYSFSHNGADEPDVFGDDYFNSVLSAVTLQAATPGGDADIGWKPESNPNP